MNKPFTSLCLGLILISLFVVSCGTNLSVNPVEGPPFDPDNEIEAIHFDDLTAEFGPVPEPSQDYRIGVVVKFLGNQYWQLLAEGMQTEATHYGITLDIRAAATEADPVGQLEIMSAMVDEEYDALLISPQTDDNLRPAVQAARQAGILILNVNDAVLQDATHWVGPNQYENGFRAATYLLEQFPEGGKAAVIKGLAGAYATQQRTKGFTETLAGTNFQVIASLPGDWDLQKSLEAAAAIIEEHPDIKGFYCNNDIMALGVVEAVNAAGKLDQIVVIGTDGIEPAYQSIRANEMAATVDTFPFKTGQVVVEVAVRLLEGQAIPRAVYSPQALITSANIDDLPIR